MKHLIFAFLFTLVTSCATPTPEQQSKIWQKRGYSKGDAELMMKYNTKYSDSHAKAVASTNAYDRSSFTASEEKLRRIFCNCVKAVGEQCVEKSSKGLTGNKKKLWGKGHAAYFTQKSLSGHVLLGTAGSSEFDPDEC